MTAYRLPAAANTEQRQSVRRAARGPGLCNTQKAVAERPTGWPARRPESPPMAQCSLGLARRQLSRGLARRQLSRRRSSTAAAPPQAAAAQALVGTTQGAAAGAAALGEGADIVGLRLAHENTYLSWSRNGIIATVAAVGIHTATLIENQPTARTTPAAAGGWPYHVTPPAAAMLGVASAFFSFGTVQYIAQLRQFSKLLKLSPLRKTWMAAHCLAATGCWGKFTSNVRRCWWYKG